MMITELTDPWHPHGTYAMMQLSAGSAERLANWCDQQGIAHDDDSEFHCTLCYSRKPVPQAEAIAGPVKITATPAAWEHLGDSATVLLLQCNKAQELWSLLQRHGATHDWPSYAPHITINSQQHLPLPTEIPHLTLIFDLIIVRPLED